MFIFVVLCSHFVYRRYVFSFFYQNFHQRCAQLCGLSFVALLITSCTDSTAIEQHNLTHTSESDQMILYGNDMLVDMGVFIDDSPTTTRGEILPDINQPEDKIFGMSWDQKPKGFSGDQVIGRTETGFDGIAAAEKSNGFYIKSKVLDSKVIQSYPSAIILEHGYFAKTTCKAGKTVKIPGMDARGKAGVFDFCEEVEVSGKYKGNKIIYARVSLGDKKLKTDRIVMKLEWPWLASAKELDSKRRRKTFSAKMGSSKLTTHDGNGEIGEIGQNPGLVEIQ